MKNQRNHARLHVGLILTLVALLSAVVLGPARLASAQAAASSWSYTGNLNETRSAYSLTVTRLLNGKVLVAGGAKCHTENNIFVCLYLNSAELYDPASG